MKFVKQLALATAATAVMTASAFAADLYVPIEEPYIPAVGAVGWTGAYVGVFGGYRWSDIDNSVFIGTSTTPTVFGVEEEEADGWVAGVTAGYNVNLDGVVLGIEGDIAWVGSGGDVAATAPAFSSDFSMNWLGTLRGRVGFAASEAFLIYATAGVAFASVDAELGGTSITGGPYSDSNVHTGWVVGAGVEAMVTDSISLKGEYLYASFGDETYEFGPSIDVVSGFDTHIAKIGLNFHF